MRTIVPFLLLAASYQRRRHVWTLIDGGPESALYKSTDGGATWRKLKTGLPTEDLGRIGLAMAPSNPDLVYAIIESVDKKGGIFRSKDRGVTWEKRNPFDQQAQYYSHLVVDPKNKDRIYVTGLSMGGFGTWSLQAYSPKRFAAIAPICGGGEPIIVKLIPHVATWVFHGAKDPVVPVARSEEMVKALKATGGTVKFTVYPDAYHDSWTATYNDPKLYEWLLEQKRPADKP